MHPRGILLPDIAALGEADAAQLGRIALKPQGLARSQFGDALGHAQPQPMLGPVIRRRAHRAEPASAEFGKPWIGNALGALDRPMYRDRKSTRLNSSH